MARCFTLTHSFGGGDGGYVVQEIPSIQASDGTFWLYDSASGKLKRWGDPLTVLALCRPYMKPTQFLHLPSGPDCGIV